MQHGLNPYGWTLQKHNLGKWGEIFYAHWDHPHEGEHEFTEALVDHLSRFIHKGDLAIDIGAHSGDTALPMAAAAGPKGMVMAFEPNPVVFEILQVNCTLNDQIAEVVPFRYAVAEARQPAKFHYTDDGFCNGGDMTKYGVGANSNVAALDVRCMRLEDLLPEKRCVSFIKIDTEGSELNIIESIKNTLLYMRPVLQIEFWSFLTADQKVELLDLVESLKYRLFVHRTSTILTKDMARVMVNFDADCLPQPI